MRLTHSSFHNSHSPMKISFLPLSKLAQALATTRWLHWAIVYSVPMAFFLVDRLVALSSILDMVAADQERTVGNKVQGILMGMLEDLVVTTLLAIALAVVEFVGYQLTRACRTLTYTRVVRWIGRVTRFLVVLALVLLLLAPFAADMILIRTRAMRFTTDLLVTYAREKKQAKALQVDPREAHLATVTAICTGLYALLFTLVYVNWIQLLAPLPNDRTDESSWVMATTPHSKLAAFTDVEAARSVREEPSTATEIRSSSGSDEEDQPDESALGVRVGKAVGFVLGYCVLVATTSAIAHAASPLTAAIGLNATLNELFRHAFHVTFVRGEGTRAIQTMGHYLSADTEEYSLFKDDVLYRRTTGFKGPLAFDLQVDQSDLPNVLLIGVESFRYLDSLYLSNNTARAAQMKKHGLTLTPQFDRWAKRGIAFSNMWSSWQTSRSLEAILFGQIAYDSVTDSGTTTGRESTQLSGMPQFFKRRGYSTAFTCGSDAKYDQWDRFLPSHGFDSLLHEPDFRTIAEEKYNVQPEEWSSKHRSFQWGVHDDLTFSILGDMILEDVRQQKQRVARHEAKQPFFRTHYTISSHGPFESIPEWFQATKLPDFSPLCVDQDHTLCEYIKRYATVRYFADLELGKFLDRLEKEGVLEDTIVLVTGDHGISPEAGMATMYTHQTDCQRVAAMLIAEGRLGKYKGTLMTDAVMQYDWLNTMMDIIGLPSDGFLQTSVGRSLKRAVQWGTRLVWSNNPMKKMSVVRGNERYVYDRVSNEEGLFDTVLDPMETKDLLASRTEEERKAWQSIRQAGRTLSAYFKDRWNNQCLTKVDC